MNKKMKIIAGGLAAVAIASAAIGGYTLKNSHTDIAEMDEETATAAPVGPIFNADSAYNLVQEQCNFGPRAMNTEAHDRCAEWIVGKFRQYGCQVDVQKATLTGYDGTPLKAQNIIARYKPDLATRIMLCAHWDSRPWADNDPDSANWRKPILAANDAASGVGVMLEVARLLQQDGKQAVGVDFVCFDAEDWGSPQWAEGEVGDGGWALGAEYFAANLPNGFNARYGILLDMVGGQGAQFYRESTSMQYASGIVKRVWKAAREVGFGSFFPRKDGGMITDDHVPMNETAHIPTIDIIPYYPDCPQSSFGPTWHTLSDDMEHIDRATLKAVGQTLIQVLYTEE